MTIQGFNKQKCDQRRRLAARRDEVEAFPLRFLRTQPDPVPENRLIQARGTLPASDALALERINEMLPENAEPLALDDVYIHYLEAANSNFIPDRFMFLHHSTLRNIQSDGAAGVAFMNSHRTGAISTPSELPYGKTFTGRYEHYRDSEGKEFRRTVLGMYMLRGEKPNGDQGPTTDSLHAGIRGGTVFDVSVGLYGGEPICDVCGKNIRDFDPETGYWLCPHVPGTSHKVTDEQREAQEARGVPGGVASYSLFDAGCGEVSAVFDGAIAGAGFGKALALAKVGMLSRQELTQARGAYATLLGRGDFGPGGDQMDEDRVVNRILRALGVRREPEEEDTRTAYPPPGRLFQTEPLQFAELRTAEPAPSQRELDLEKQLEAEKAARRQDAERNARERAEQFASGLVQGNRSLPYQKEDIAALHAQMGMDDHDKPVKLKDHTGTELSRTVMLEGLLSARQPHSLTQNLFASGLPQGAAVLAPTGATEDEQLALAAKDFWERNRRPVSNGNGNGRGH